MIKIKGAVLNDAIIAVKNNYGQQVYNQIIDQLDNTSKETYNNTILTSGWYPLEHFLNFVEIDIKLTAAGNDQEIINRAENLIEKELKGIYKIFVKLGSPKFVFKRLSAVHQSYFKGVSAEIMMEEDKKVKIKYTGFKKNHRLIENSIIGFYRKALEISGAERVKTRILTSVTENKGYYLLEISWTGK